LAGAFFGAAFLTGVAFLAGVLAGAACVVAFLTMILFLLKINKHHYDARYLKKSVKEIIFS
jgi:hypothetical protein